MTDKQLEALAVETLKKKLGGLSYGYLLESTKHFIVEALKEMYNAGAKEGWISEKPDKECLFISATLFRDNWDYRLWQIIKHYSYNDEGEYGWYYSLCEGDGQEWGPLDDLSADLYKIIIAPNKTT